MFELKYDISLEDHLEAQAVMFSEKNIPFFMRSSSVQIMLFFSTICISSALLLSEDAIQGTAADLFGLRLMIDAFLGMQIYHIALSNKPQKLLKIHKRRIARDIRRHPSFVGGRKLLLSKDVFLLRKLNTKRQKGFLSRILKTSERKEFQWTWSDFLIFYETENLYVFVFKDKRMGHTFFPKKAFVSVSQMSDFQVFLNSMSLEGRKIS